MSEIIERMARAICRDGMQRGALDPAHVDKAVDQLWTLDREAARAALAAIREPTEAMTHDQRDEYGELRPEHCAHVWRAMVDEALR